MKFMEILFNFTISFPYSVFEYEEWDFASLFMIWVLESLKVCQMLQFIINFEYINVKLNFHNKNFRRIVNLMSILFAIIHVFASLRILAGLNPEAPVTWAWNRKFFTHLDSQYVLYTEGTFNAILTVSTLGYRNYNAPDNPIEITLSIFSLIIGGVFFSIFLSIVSNIFFEYAAV